MIRAEDFEISTKYELGELFRNLVGRAWTLFFYVTISLYIYGDLSIYAVAVSKSLRDVTCNVSAETLNETDPCWSPSGISRTTVYKICLTIFACVLGPPFFCNVTKIRWLQASTIIARWVAVLLMSSIAIARIIEFPEVPRLRRHQMPAYMSLLGSPDRPHPPIANFSNLPKAFGVCVYAFMCHHSLPGVITPIDKKQRLFSSIMLPVYLLIYFCYLLLSGTGITAFDYIHDLYTLNFVPSNDPTLRPGWLLLLLEYFLALYPAFALSSNFPVLGTTLSNNLIAIFLALLPPGRMVSLVIRWCVPFLALIPPILIALAVNDVGQLVSVTGAFGGIFIMYVFPVVLVFYARRALQAKFKSETPNDESVVVDQRGRCTVNRYQSPFSHPIWPVVVTVWATSCLIFLILNKLGVF
uniref:Transmembrane protein 104 n=1 Tax=Echinococcus granulosus TaxID=6210 RepID=A0A068WAX7_ECHGR|nr:transmembrane protein 104 [Echinococcus granulosus]